MGNLPSFAKLFLDTRLPTFRDRNPATFIAQLHTSRVKENVGDTTLVPNDYTSHLQPGKVPINSACFVNKNMSEDQDLTFELIIKGYNVIRTGQAGTWTILILEKLTKAWGRCGRRIGLTSTTGLGAAVHGGKACTPHYVSTTHASSRYFRDKRFQLW